MVLEPGIESYPPPFRPTLQQRRRHHQADSGGNDTAEPERWGCVPVFDARCLPGDLRRLGAACRSWGVIRLVNHGIPPTLLRDLHGRAKAIFELPFESKRALSDEPTISYFWGTPALSPSGVALSGRGRTAERVEGFNVPVDRLHHHHHHHHHHLFDSFRQLLVEYEGHLARIARAICDALMASLNPTPNPIMESNSYPDPDPEQPKRRLPESAGLLRVYRYPPAVAPPETAAGLAEHTDSSVLSIVSQNDVAGLQVFKDGDWLTVEPIPDSLILNIGDMMQAMSDDEYKSVRHRVVAREGEAEERISLCYFVFPPAETVIRSSRYRAFTYGEFQARVQEDIQQFGTKVGLRHFQLASHPIGGAEQKHDATVESTSNL